MSLLNKFDFESADAMSVCEIEAIIYYHRQIVLMNLLNSIPEILLINFLIFISIDLLTSWVQV